MASVVLFIVMVIVALIALLVAAITATVGASDAGSSSSYNNNSSIRSGHSFLVITAILTWIIFATLAIFFIIAWLAGGLFRVEVSEAFLRQSTMSKTDYLNGYKALRDLEGKATVRIITIVVLFMLLVVIFMCLVLAIVAAAQLGSVKPRDSKTSSAFTMAIITAVALGVVLLAVIVTIIAFFGINSAIYAETARLEYLLNAYEAQNGIAPTVQVVLPTHAAIQTPTIPTGPVLIPTGPTVTVAH
jgi:hypothetical protein